MLVLEDDKDVVGIVEDLPYAESFLAVPSNPVALAGTSSVLILCSRCYD